MVRYSVHIKGLVLPVAGIVCLEFLWNLLGFIINPMLLDIPLHLVKYGLYALAGYTASAFFNSESTEAVIHGGIAGGIGAIIEGLLVAPLFYGWFFYMPGFPLFHALYHILSLSITGAFFGFVGSFLSGMTEFDFVAQFVQNILDNPWMNEPMLDGTLNIGNDRLSESTNLDVSVDSLNIERRNSMNNDTQSHFEETNNSEPRNITQPPGDLPHEQLHNKMDHDENTDETLYGDTNYDLLRLVTEENARFELSEEDLERWLDATGRPGYVWNALTEEWEEPAPTTYHDGQRKPNEDRKPEKLVWNALTEEWEEPGPTTYHDGQRKPNEDEKEK